MRYIQLHEVHRGNHHTGYMQPWARLNIKMSSYLYSDYQYKYKAV